MRLWIPKDELAATRLLNRFSGEHARSNDPPGGQAMREVHFIKPVHARFLSVTWLPHPSLYELAPALPIHCSVSPHLYPHTPHDL